MIRRFIKKNLPRFTGYGLSDLSHKTLSSAFVRLWLYDLYEEPAKEALRDLRKFGDIVDCHISFSAPASAGHTPPRYSSVRIDMDSKEMIDILLNHLNKKQNS
ncbi:MAG: hypothetical protein MR609_07390 [Bacteroidales bacterium]|nr:hypothetical protein [Bacteroidales bacterium]